MSWTPSRRRLLLNATRVAGGVALGAALPGGGFIQAAMADELADPLAPKAPHFEPKIKSVIWLHMDGAPSTLELWDYKPELERLAGEEVPESFLEGIKTSTQGGVGKLFATPRTWAQHGESGAWFSDFLPHLSAHADDIAFIKSSKTVGATHDISILKLNTGDLNPGRPTLGASISYALGTANPDLPPYVVLYPGQRAPDGGSVNWNAGFLPAVYQGTPFRPGPSPILYVERPELVSDAARRDSLDLLRTLNQHSASRYPHDAELQARLNSYELAHRMESAAPEAVDLSTESEATRRLYGLDDPLTADYGTCTLRARRLVERGVRFVQVVSAPLPVLNDVTPDTNWDAHQGLDVNHRANARAHDKPIAGLLADLKALGLLETTLVVWTSEFGRTPYGQSGNGRDHNPWGYTQWLAGGGVRAGATFGATDEIGLKSIGAKVDTYDLHATVLHLFGLDHLRTTYLHNGRQERPTVVYGEVIHDLLA